MRYLGEELFEPRIGLAILAMHARQQPVERQGPQLAHRQAKCAGAGLNGGIPQFTVAGLQDRANSMPIEICNSREVFLVPSALFDQSGDLGGDFNGITGGIAHQCDASAATPLRGESPPKYVRQFDDSPTGAKSLHRTFLIPCDPVRAGVGDQESIQKRTRFDSR